MAKTTTKGGVAARQLVDGDVLGGGADKSSEKGTSTSSSTVKNTASVSDASVVADRAGDRRSQLTSFELLESPPRLFSTSYPGYVEGSTTSPRPHEIKGNRTGPVSSEGRVVGRDERVGGVGQSISASVSRRSSSLKRREHDRGQRSAGGRENCRHYKGESRRYGW